MFNTVPDVREEHECQQEGECRKQGQVVATVPPQGTVQCQVGGQGSEKVFWMNE